MATQEFSLKWNNHHPTVLSILDRLFQSETLVDVTLVAEGKSLKVHRLILAACSSYFQEMVDLHREKAMVIFLKDVKYAELEALVHYMYRGEVKVAQSNLSSLIRTAESLKIKGLAETDEVENHIPADTNYLHAGQESPLRKRRRFSGERKTPLEVNSSLVHFPNAAPLKNEGPATSPVIRSVPQSIIPRIIPSVLTHDRPEDVSEASIARDSSDINLALYDDQHLEEITGACSVVTKFETSADESEMVVSQSQDEDWNDEDFSALLGEQSEHDNKEGNDQGSLHQAGTRGRFSCPKCSKTFSQEDNLQRHLTRPCPGRAFACHHCQRKFTRKDTLKTHLRTFHSDLGFVCDVCQKKLPTQYTLNRHREIECETRIPLECPYCDKVYSRKDGLKLHIHKKHSCIN